MANPADAIYLDHARLLIQMRETICHSSNHNIAAVLDEYLRTGAYSDLCAMISCFPEEMIQYVANHGLVQLIAQLLLFRDDPDRTLGCSRSEEIDRGRVIGELILRRCEDRRLPLSVILESLSEMREEFRESGLLVDDLETIIAICDPGALARDCSWAHQLLLELSPSMVRKKDEPSMEDLDQVRSSAQEYHRALRQGGVQIQSGSLFQKYPKLVIYLLDRLGIGPGPFTRARSRMRLDTLSRCLAQYHLTPADLYWILVHAQVSLDEL